MARLRWTDDYRRRYTASMARLRGIEYAMWARCVARTLKSAGIASPSILEVGAGPGYFAAEVAKRVAPSRVVVSDESPEMVQIAETQLSGDGAFEFEVASSTSLPWEDGTFDVTLSKLVLHEVEQWPGALGEMARVTRKGGMVFVIDVDGASPMWMSRALSWFLRTFRDPEIGAKFMEVRAMAHARQEVAGWVEDNSFRLERNFSLGPFFCVAFSPT